jgi:site-specific recombinase XerD
MTRFAGWLRSTPIQPWRGQTARSVWGVHGVLVDTKAFVRWLAEEERIPHAPKVPITKLPQRLFPILTDEELGRVFASRHLDPHTEVGIRNRALIAFMLDTAVRLSEAAGLTLADLDLADGSARIFGKGHKERLVYISTRAADAVRRWLAIRGEADGSLFWLSVEGVRMVFKRVQADAELAVFTPHQLRHTALTAMVKQNMDLHSIKRIAGHASVTTTEAYLALAGEDVRRKHHLASPFDRIQSQLDPAPPPRRRLKAR